MLERGAPSGDHRVGTGSERVLGCDGSGATSGVIAGVDWVTADHDPGEPAVANMSLGGGVSSTLDNAVAASINSGVTYALAAGNSNAAISSSESIDVRLGPVTNSATGTRRVPRTDASSTSAPDT